MKLIDADEFLAEASKHLDMQDLYLPVHIKDIVIDAMPTVDAVPVIRCKDCEHWQCDDVDSYCDELGIFNTDMNSYCSYAKKGNK